MSATFTPDDANNYETVTKNVKINVSKANQTITFANPGAKTYGDAPFNLGGTASSNLTVTYSIVSGAATISGSTLTMNGAGGVTVRASQSGNDNYNAAEDVTQTFTVNPRSTSVAVTSSLNPSSYGQAVTFTANVSGTGAGNPNDGSVQFKIDGANFGSPVAISSGGAATLTANDLSVTNAAAHVVEAFYLGSNNFAASSGALSGGQKINKATLLAAAENKSGTYSDALPALTYTINGFINGDTASVVAGAPAFSTTANIIGGKITSGAGTYAITPSPGSLSTANYSFNFAPGILTVGKETTQTDYTGDNYVITAGPNVGTASAVRLAAHLSQEADGAPGDLALAKARIELYKFSNTTTTPNYVFGNLAVNSSGDVETTVSVAVDDAYTVRVIVESANSYWTAQPVYEATLTVAYGSAERRVTGGGWVADTGSANRKGSFGFTVNYGNNGSPKGNALYTFRGADGFNYRVKSNSWQSGGLTFYQEAAKAAFGGKCNVQKIDAATGAVVESWGGYTFTVDLIDGDLRNPRETDRYAIQILTDAGIVWRQIGSRVNPIQLGGGNVSVQKR